MSNLQGLTSTRKRRVANTDEICAIMECDTYSRGHVDRILATKANNVATAIDILTEEAIDADSRLHAFFALDFLSEEDSLNVAFIFIEQMVKFLDLEEEIYDEYVSFREQYEELVYKKSTIDTRKLHETIKTQYNALKESKAKLVFEALMKPLLVDIKYIAPGVAGCMRAIADSEEERCMYLKTQINGLVEYMSAH